MIIQLKERHLCYALHLIQGETIGSLFDTAVTVINAIRDNIEGEEDLLEVDVPGNIIYDIWVKAGALPEAFSWAINQEIKELLMPQIMALNTTESNDLLMKLQAYSIGLTQMMESNINEARNKIIQTS